MARSGVKTCRWFSLGLVPFDEARRLQERLADDTASGRGASLLLLEHPHIYTFGRRGHEENLLWDQAQRAARGVEIRWTDRGGDVTYHGPGQLVGYPILPLGPMQDNGRLPQADYVGFIRRLEQTLSIAAARLGLVTGQQTGLTGVWVQPDVASRCPRCPPAARKHPAKLASIGVKVDARGITRHGFALNVSPDMTYWDGIVACGLLEYPAVSLAQLLEPPPPMETVRRSVVDAFGEVFGLEMIEDRLARA